MDGGPRVRVVFEGEPLPRAARRDIPALYRPARLAEATSLEEMRRATFRALRSRGFVDPEVDLTVDLDDPLAFTRDASAATFADGGLPQIVDRLAAARTRTTSVC